MTMVELIVVVTLIAIVAAISGPSLVGYYRDRQLRMAAAQVRTIVRYARHNAVKEKVQYRIVLNDESAVASNRCIVQNDAGGSFATLTGQIYPLEDVDILGSGGTNSMDNVTVSTRGECTAGTVFLRRDGGRSMTVTILTTCGVEIS